jgi:hypothetical protein
MNGKKMACVVLSIIIAIMVYCAQILHQQADDKRAAANNAESEQFMANAEKEQADIRVQASKANTETLRKFLTAWREPINRVQTQTEVEEAIQSSLRMNNLVVMSQRFEKKVISDQPVIPAVVKATIVIQDEYSKTLNWLGELERRLPLCRINTCHVTGAEEARQVQTEVALEVPLINLNSDVKKS